MRPLEKEICYLSNQVYKFYYEIAKKECSNCILIETAEELDKNCIKNINTIGIMAGASTPNESVENTVEKLNKIC